MILRLRNRGANLLTFTGVTDSFLHHSWSNGGLSLSFSIHYPLWLHLIWKEAVDFGPRCSEEVAVVTEHRLLGGYRATLEDQSVCPILWLLMVNVSPGLMHIQLQISLCAAHEF